MRLIRAYRKWRGLGFYRSRALFLAVKYINL